LKRGVDGKFQIMMVEGTEDVDEWVDVANQEKMNLLAQQAGAKAAPVKEKPVVRHLFKDEIELEKMKKEQADLEKKHAELTQKMKGLHKSSEASSSSGPPRGTTSENKRGTPSGDTPPQKMQVDHYDPVLAAPGITQEQYPGLCSKMMLLWPNTWFPGEVEQRCKELEKGQSALKAVCTQCAFFPFTKATQDPLADGIPDWVQGEGWYAVCKCGNQDQWPRGALQRNIAKSRSIGVKTLAPVEPQVAKTSEFSFLSGDDEDKVFKLLEKYLTEGATKMTPLEVSKAKYYTGHSHCDQWFKDLMEMKVQKLQETAKRVQAFENKSGDDASSSSVIPIKLAEVVAPPTFPAAPTQDAQASASINVGSIQHSDDLISEANLEEVRHALNKLGATFTITQSETIHQELRRMAVANRLAKENNLYINDYRTWCDVNKHHYSNQAEWIQAWAIQKKVLEKMTATRKETVLNSEVDLNTAPLEHLECLPLTQGQIKNLIDYRAQRPFMKMSDVELVPGIGTKTMEKVMPFLKPLAHDEAGYKSRSKASTADRMPNMVIPKTATNKILNLFNAVGGEAAMPKTGPPKAPPKGPHPTLAIPGHVSFQTPSKPVTWARSAWADLQPSSSKRSEGIHKVQQYPSDVLNITSSTMKVGDLWADSGCVRGVGGKDGHRENRKLLAEYGLKPIQVQCWEQFQFGNGDIVPSTTKYFYPTFITGIFRGALDQAEVDVACPQLMSKQMMKTWNMDLCFGSSTTKIKKFGVELPFSEKEVPIVNIFDFTAKDVREQWNRIPDHFKVSSTPPPEHLDKQRRVVLYKDGKTVTVEAAKGRAPRVVHSTEVFELEQ